VDVSIMIRHRMEELGLGQRDLARAARVTESYISQLLTRKKPPPAPNRTDIYEKLDRCLKLPRGELARLANMQRQELLKRELAEEPAPLFHEVRALALRKCTPGKANAVRAIFERQPFGELERLVTRKLLEVAKRVARQELDNDKWLRVVARRSGQSYEEMRVVVLEFLDTSIFQSSIDNCVSFLDPLIESWDIDLATFDLEIVLDGKVGSGHVRRFGFVETVGEDEEQGMREFLSDPALSRSVTETELDFLKRLTFTGMEARPTGLYYYRELQNLRDPLHFRVPRDE
jgi:transcriptional regulator with XRE-family HTH domain